MSLLENQTIYSDSQTNQRLSRIEDKLDILNSSLVAIARIEEKILNLEKHNTFLMEKIIRVEESVNKIEKDTKLEISSFKENIVDAINLVNFLKRVFWIILGGIVTAAAAGWFFIF
jgi:predicted  nucleic acid-binding Zn-ribbon protein